jgi:hypothetical protein
VKFPKTSKRKSKAQALHVAYELHSLGWKAFQDLCATIAREIWGQTIQIFFDSNDGGRDGAFHGTWKNEKGEILNGSFTVQCKFTAKTDKQLQVSDLSEEFDKAVRLAKRGLANNYILFSNAHLTGKVEETLKNDFEAISGIQNFRAYGRESISGIIRESPRLRMLVPCIYGLGDLSQILDERAYTQANEILSSLGDDLRKFVVTNAYEQSAQALVKHGFVLLLGDPACGKSTIAAGLSLGALDEWGCSTLKITSAADFKNHWNPNNPNQFFWLDDAFGATQLDIGSVTEWNRIFPHVHAATRKGTKVLFTSRNYIYHAAKSFLKESSFPKIRGSQVVINVEELTNSERQQILYNHIRLGSQLKEFKSKVKVYLPGIATHKKLSPEIARRLSDPLFTQKLNVTKEGLNNFIEHPIELLCDVITNLHVNERAALALIFMRGGTLTGPVEMTKHEEVAIQRIGSSMGLLTESLNALNGSLVLCAIRGGNYIWQFKHPSIRDAFASIIAQNHELMDIYLAGTPIKKLLREVSCNTSIEGVKLIIPPNRYEKLQERISALNLKKKDDLATLHWFLSFRCDQRFMEIYLSQHPEFISTLQIRAYLSAGSDINVITRLHEFGFLSEEVRRQFVKEIRELALNIPDSGFLMGRIKCLLTDEEYNETLEYIRIGLLPNLNRTIEDWNYDYESNKDMSPDSFFEPLNEALQDFRLEFENDEKACVLIDQALLNIQKSIEKLLWNLPDNFEDDSHYERIKSDNENARSIFEDVDE